MEKNNNVIQTDFGYEIEWAKFDNYGAKIIVFSKKDKTPFWYNVKTEKTWFVNSGSFIFRWIDTSDGQIYQNNSQEGSVFTAKPLVPCSIECTSANGGLSETNNGHYENDKFIVIKKENY
jgi:hypothetical protein